MASATTHTTPSQATHISVPEKIQEKVKQMTDAKVTLAVLESFVDLIIYTLQDQLPSTVVDEARQVELETPFLRKVDYADALVYSETTFQSLLEKIEQYYPQVKAVHPGTQQNPTPILPRSGSPGPNP